MIIAFFEGVEVFYNVLFAALPSVMRIIAFSLLLTTLGRIMSNRKGWKWTLAKIAHGLFYIGWAMYKFQVLYAYSLGEQVFASLGIMLMMLALMITYIGRNLSFFGYRVINYYTLWGFYFGVLTILLFFEYTPGAIGFSIFYLGACIIALVLTRTKVKQLTEE